MPNKFNSDIQKSENVQLLLRNKNKMFATVTSLKPSEEFMAAKVCIGERAHPSR